jgi:hypothetical protein
VAPASDSVDGVGHEVPVPHVDHNPVAPVHGEQQFDDIPMSTSESAALYQPLESGYVVTVDCHLKPGDVGHYQRLLIKCPLSSCQHSETKPCQKYRSLSDGHQVNFGQREPEAYLLAWAEAASRFTDRAAHMRHRPSIADVRDALAKYALRL